MPATIVFDLDGTLWDSRAWYEEVFVRNGASRRDIRRGLEDDRPPMLIAYELGIERQHFFEWCESAVQDLRLYPRVVETLETLVSRGHRLAIATTQAADFTNMILTRRGMSGFFEVVVTPTRQLRAKPHPDTLLRTLALMDLEGAATSFYVGDRDADCAAAKSAGLEFIWASYGYGARCHHDAISMIENFGDLLSL